MALAPGSLVYVDYGEVPRTIHARVILDHVTGAEHVGLTPDFDIYSEVYDPALNEDIVNFWPGNPNGALPRGVPSRSVYGFAPMSAAQLSRFMNLGRSEGARLRAERGVDAAHPVVNAPGGAAPETVADARADEFWVLAEHVAGRKIGERVQLAAGSVTDGRYGLVRVTDAEGKERPCLVHRLVESELSDFCDERIQNARASEALEGDEKVAADDVRTLEVKFGHNGERQRSFRESVKELQMTEFEDFPLHPRTTLDYCRAIAGIAESATAQHHIWMNSSGIPSGDRSVYEDQILARILDVAICYDSLDVSNLACIELVCRRRQLIADAHAGNPAAPSYLGAEHYLGETYKLGGGVVVPSLTDHVSRKLQAQSQIMKEKRKMAEAASSKGGKKGPPNKPPPAGKALGADPQ
eukprot:s440_g5.t1